MLVQEDWIDLALLIGVFYGIYAFSFEIIKIEVQKANKRLRWSRTKSATELQVSLEQEFRL